jgi:hypothetical protein
MGRDCLRKLLLLVGSVVFTLLLAEGVFRLFPLLRPLPRTYVGEYENAHRRTIVADPVLGWKMRPGLQEDIGLGVVQYNAQGFRALSDFDPNQPCQRIAFAGDSFTFGMEVRYEKTFPALTGAGLAGSCADNLGIPGFGLDQIWLTLRTYALPLHPRLVVVAFISGDFARSEEAFNRMQNLNKPTFKLAHGRLVPETAEDRPNFLVRFLQHHSSLWRVARLADRTLAHYYPYGEWWNLNAAILDAIRDDCRRAGVPVLFVYIPTDEWGAFPSLRKYMARCGANFVDLSQGEFELTPEMYFNRGYGNRHLNDKGHRQVANAVLSWVHQGLPTL